MASLPKTKSENVHLTYVLLVSLLRVITSSIELHKFETAGYFPQVSQGVLRCHRNYESLLIAVYVVFLDLILFQQKLGFFSARPKTDGNVHWVNSRRRRSQVNG